MPKKYFYLLVFSLILLSLAGSSLAIELEVNYPPLPGITITEESAFPHYLKYIYTFGMVIAGVLALLALIIGGIHYMASAGNPEAMSDAKGRMIGGILGLLLLFSSYLILDYINPNLKNLELVTLEPLPGVFYLVKGEEERNQALPFSSDTAPLLEQGWQKILYECPEGKGMPIKCIGYKEKDLKEPFMKTELSCGETKNITLFEAALSCWSITPGIDFELAEEYKNDPSSLFAYLNSDVPYTSSILDFGEGLRKKYGQVITINKIIDPDNYLSRNNTYYGGVLHGSINYRGECKFVDSTSDTSLRKWTDIEPKYSSISIFEYNQLFAPTPSPGTSAEEMFGVCLYRQEDYDSKGGRYCIPDGQIDPYVALNLDTEGNRGEVLEFKEIGPPLCEKKDEEGYCVDSDNNPILFPVGGAKPETDGLVPNLRSIRINGNYWIVFFDKKQDNGGDVASWTQGDAETWDGNCQVFKQNILNLSESLKFVPKSVLVIPVR